MGSFYVNCCVRGLDQDELLVLLRQGPHAGFVGPTVDGWTAFVAEDLEMQDENVIESYGRRLTRDTDRVAIAFQCHDEDVLKAYLFRDGEKVGEFDSNPAAFLDPGEFDPETMTFSNPPPTEEESRPVLHGKRSCAEVFGLDEAGVKDLLPQNQEEVVRLLLTNPRTSPEMIAHLQTHGLPEGPLELHQRWAETLGLPAYSVAMSFGYVERGESLVEWAKVQ